MKKHYLLLLLFAITQTYSQCWSKVSAGFGFTLAIKTDGTLWACGDNDQGQLGDGTVIRRFDFVQIGTYNDWKAISAGSFHSLATKIDGTLWAWGGNANGELGIGSYVNRSIPTRVGTDSNWMIPKARAGGSSAIKSNGDLYCWGKNNLGQLGIGFTGANVNSPAWVDVNSFWLGISGSGYDFTVGIRAGGTIWAWGNNAYGQLGTGSFYNEYTPFQIGHDSDWKEISAGNYSCIALKTDGTMWAWGRNAQGEFGNGTVTSQISPVQIGTDLWKHVSAGPNHCIGIKMDNSLWAWGANWYGQLGDGTTTGRRFPILVDDSTDYDSLMPGGNHSLALRIDGSLIGMGFNEYGQLGLGVDSVPSAYLPIDISCEALATNEYSSIENAFVLYPNPVKDILHIENEKNIAINRIVISDLSGKIVLQKDNSKEINVEFLQNGLYILQIQSESNISQKKFIKY